MEFCEVQSVKDELYDEQRKRLETGSYQRPAALGENLKTFLRIARVTGGRNCNEIFSVLIMYWEDIADKTRRNYTAHLVRSLKALISIKRMQYTRFDRV